MDTEDLVQQSLYRAMRSIGALEEIDPNALKRYLMVSVDNLIRDEVRRAASGEVVNATAEVPEPENSPTVLWKLMSAGGSAKRFSLSLGKTSCSSSAGSTSACHMSSWQK